MVTINVYVRCRIMKNVVQNSNSKRKLSIDDVIKKIGRKRRMDTHDMYERK